MTDPALALYTRLSAVVTDSPEEVARMVRVKFPGFVVPERPNINRDETKHLLGEIEAFLVRKAITPTRFGTLTGDGSLIGELRDGRVLAPPTRTRLRAFMQANKHADLRPNRDRTIIADPIGDAPKPEVITGAARDNARFLARLLPAKLESLARQGLIERAGR